LFALLLHYILLPSPLGEGLGVRPFSPCLSLTYYSPLPLERGWGGGWEGQVGGQEGSDVRPIELGMRVK